MERLIKDVKRLTNEELTRAISQHGAKHNSLHEAYAVIKEELEETYECLENLYLKLERDYFDCARNDDTNKSISIANEMYAIAIHAAAEAIQVAAMAKKATFGLRIDDEKGEQK